MDSLLSDLSSMLGAQRKFNISVNIFAKERQSLREMVQEIKKASSLIAGLESFKGTKYFRNYNYSADDEDVCTHAKARLTYAKE
jgi:hypothetical protein